MKIERINDNTIKFYISYLDIEDRGFNREEIWYNRERSEQLFWQVMEEADDEEEFEIDGPLWIQVQAMEKGLEITVTKAQMSKDGQNLEVPVDQVLQQDQLNEKLEDLLEFSGDDSDKEDTSSDDEQKVLPYLVRFKSFEELIQLSHVIGDTTYLNHAIYHYKDAYMMIYTFDDTHVDEIIQLGTKGKIEEYGDKAKESIAMILEYGKPIFIENGLEEIKKLFDI